MKYEIEIIDNLESLVKIDTEWDELFTQCSRKNVFLSYTWISSWCIYLQNEYKLFIIIVRDKQNKIVGIAPLGIKNNKKLKINFRVLSFITDAPSDYQDFLILHDNEAIVDEIIHVIEKNKNKWDVVELVNFPHNAINIELILNNKIQKYRKRNCAFCPQIEFIDNDLTIESKISKKIKQDVFYQIRKLEKNARLEFYKVSDKNEILEFMNLFCELHIKRWHGTTTPSTFNEISFKNFFITLGVKMFNQNLAACSHLLYNGKVVASHFGFRLNDRFYYYFPAYDPDFSKNSIGKVLLYMLLKSEVNIELKVFDLLRGNEGYKKQWATIIHNNVQLTSFKFNLKGLIWFCDWFYNKNRSHFIFRVYRKTMKLFNKTII